MKKNVAIFLTMAAVAIADAGFHSLSAQVTNAAPDNASPPPAAAPVPGAPPMMPRQQMPMPPRRNLGYVQPAMMVLGRTVAELQRSDNDYGGHRQAAIDACKKAIDELQSLATAAGLPAAPMRPGGPTFAPQMRPMPPQGAPPPGTPAQPAPAQPAPPSNP